MWGSFCKEALQRIGRRPDRPDRADLAAFLAGALIHEEVAERLARAIELFWDDQPDESAHVIVPRLEQVIRTMARQVGLPIVREPMPGRDIGGLDTLGSILADLGQAFADEGWHAYLYNLLVDPLGMNLRNLISHGLHGRVGANEAALLIQAAVFLAGVSLIPAESLPVPPAGSVTTHHDVTPPDGAGSGETGFGHAD